MESGVKKIRSKVINLATHLALEEVEVNGGAYYRTNSQALNDACKILKIDTNEFLKMFI